MLRAQDGDESAFRQLHDLWRHEVERMAVVRIGQLQGGQDVAQDAWVSIARGIYRLSDPACFPRWALQIVQRRAADWVRRIQRERRNRENNQSVHQAALIPTDLRQSALAEAVAVLPVEDRTMLTLFYELGRSVGEIAEIVKVPAGTVKSRLYALRERLRNEIEKEKL